VSRPLPLLAPQVACCSRYKCRTLTLPSSRVEGEIRSKGHDDKTAVFDGTTIPLRRWEDWEKSRLRKLKREEKRRKDFERHFGAGFHGEESFGNTGTGGSSDGGHGAPGQGGLAPWARARSEYDSDAGSVFSSDEDVWGGEIGGVGDSRSHHHSVSADLNLV
jgi:chitin synthase